MNQDFLHLNCYIDESIGRHDCLCICYSKNFFNMDRRKFIKKSGQAILAVSAISITASMATSCSSDDDSSFDDGYYGDGYYDDGYYDDGYYDDGYYDD